MQSNIDVSDYTNTTSQPPFDLFFTTFDYELPVGYCVTETKNNKLISNLTFQEDFSIVNRELWKLLKKYFEAGAV